MIMGEYFDGIVTKDEGREDISAEGF